ncbi:MAG: AbrB/MazE/SpoVT family DNA-binding domain-containing protein [Candidatus Aminicenantes bacterium]|nr:AbrB/MazE/SpoVT family DNA-binding domain-containing protein [Candidatus Aminicenantes bacterium]
METIVITSKGQIVIPAKIRRRLNIKKGTRLHVEERDHEIVLKPLDAEYFKKVSGILSTKGKLSKLLLEERKLEKEREG